MNDSTNSMVPLPFIHMEDLGLNSIHNTILLFMTKKPSSQRKYCQNIFEHRYECKLKYFGTAA